MGQLGLPTPSATERQILIDSLDALVQERSRHISSPNPRLCPPNSALEMLLPFFIVPRFPSFRHPRLYLPDTGVGAVDFLTKGIAEGGVILGERGNEHLGVAVAA